MRWCSICGKRFKPNKENRYEAEELKSVVGVLTGDNSKVWECFDCPACGCQNKVNTRLPRVHLHKPSEDELDQAFRQGYEKGYERCKKDNEI